MIRQARHHADASTVDGYLSFLAQTSQRAYSAGSSVRLAFTASDEADLRTKLLEAVELIVSEPDRSEPAPLRSTPNGIHYGTGRATGDVAFVFPGQGSQYLFMGADLAMNFSEAIGRVGSGR